MSQQGRSAPGTRAAGTSSRAPKRRRRKLKTIDEAMLVGIAGGALYLILLYVVGTSRATAGYAGGGLALVLVGAYLRPWVDRVVARCGVRIVRTKGRRQ